MADTLNVYKGESLVSSSAYAEGKATVTINELEANTDYPLGTYKVARQNEHGESAKVDVPAFKTKPITVTGVTLNKESTSIEVGFTETLSATVAPSTATDKTVVYTSSNGEVATVDNQGVVTAVATGTADITVTTTDGNKTAVTTVTVTAAA